MTKSEFVQTVGFPPVTEPQKVDKLGASLVSQDEKPGTNPVTALAVLLLFSLGITGFLAYQNYQLKEKAVGVQAKPIPTLTPTVTPVATKLMTGWKTYTSDVNKFQIKYPPGWEMIDPAKTLETNDLLKLKSPIVIDSPSEPLIYNITLYFEGPAEGKTARQFIDEAGIPPETRETVIIDGKTAELTVGFPSRAGSIDVTFIHNNFRYHFLLTPYDLDDPAWKSDRYEALFRQILSTFKFVE